MNTIKITIAHAFLLLFVTLSIHAQVSLAPTMLFIHDYNNVGELYVTNRSDIPQEVSVSFVFGYPVSDESGMVTMRYDDQERMQQYGLDEYVRVFPRQLMLQEGQSQTIRFQVLPMANRPDGMYWTRAVVTSVPRGSDVGTVVEDQAVGARVTVALEQNIPMFYRKGNTTTGIIVHQVFSDIDQERLVLRAHVSRNGNSPFLGTLSAEMFDSSGAIVQSKERSAFFYFEEYRQLEIPIQELQPGRYRVNLHFDTQRRDIAFRDLVQAERQTHTIEVEI